MMVAEPPGAGTQACPRSLRLLPDRLWVPPTTLGIMLRRGAIPLHYSGWGLEPDLRDGAAIEARGGVTPRRGDLAIVGLDGHADLLRLMEPAGGGAWRATLDGYPRRRVRLGPGSILGVVTAIEGRRPHRLRSLLASRAGLGAACLAVRRIASAPRWDASASGSVLEKYARQAPEYAAKAESNLTEEHLRLLAERVGPRRRVLVAGCGTGAEALHLERAGHHVVGFDALPAMIEAAAARARAAGAEARFAVADARRGDWPAGPYDAAYLTPLLYSFLHGRRSRIAFLVRLGRSLRSGGIALYSARLHAGLRSWLETRLAWCRPASDTGPGDGEPGDWYTRYLAPDGSIGVSFLRRFDAGEVTAEARAAGFGWIERRRADFLAGGFRAP